MGLAALAGAASTGASQIVKKIAGKGQTGGFLIPQNKIDKLIANKHLRNRKEILLKPFNQVQVLLLSQLKNNLVVSLVLYLQVSGSLWF